MITLRKLASLKESTRLRKIAALFQGFEFELSRGGSVNLVYIKGLTALLAESDGFIGSNPEFMHLSSVSITSVSGCDTREEREKLLRGCNAARHMLLRYLQAEPADWDMFSHEEAGEDRGADRACYPVSVFLEDLRSPFNVGSVFRTAEYFGVKDICITPGTADPEHKRALRSAMGCTKFIPWRRAALEDIAGRPVFALELGGTSIGDFEFPRSGVVILGSEELGVSPEALSLADNSLGRVSIPGKGLKGSLNVSVAFGILMGFWHSALQRFG